MEQNRVKSVLRRWVQYVLEHSTAVFLVALVLTVLAVLLVVSRFDIRSDIKDLMPPDAKSVTDTYTITERLGSITELKIVLEAPNTELTAEAKASETYKTCVAQAETREEKEEALAYCENALVIFARALTATLESHDDLVGYVHFHNDKSFFEDHALMYASEEDLQELRADIGRVFEYKACVGSGIPKDECDEEFGRKSEEETSYDGEQGAGEGSEINYFKEYPLEQLQDGAWIIRISLRFRDSSTSFKAIDEHLGEVKKIVAELAPKKYNPGLFVTYGGGFKTQSEEYHSVVNDVLFSAGMTFGSIFLLMVLFFRRLRAVVVIMTPLLMSVAWTLAVAFGTIGYLNLITAFIFAILLGLGIDFGIHILARLDEERISGKDMKEAVEIAIVEVGSANLAGAITTSATFFALMIAEFRGFSQFGLVAGVGVLMSLLSMLTVLPAIVVIAHRLKEAFDQGCPQSRWIDD